MLRTGPIRIVVVDDDVSYRRLVALNLDGDGRFVLVGEAAGGLEALGVVGRASPDVAWLDLHLPSLDGMSLLRLLLDQHPQLAVVVVTADDEQVERALANGAAAAIVKGTAVDDVMDLVATSWTRSAPGWQRDAP